MRMASRFFEILDALDQVLASGPRDLDFESGVRPLLVQEHARRYFYNKVPSAEWLAFLFESGVYRELPVSGNEGSEQEPLWYELIPVEKFGESNPLMAAAILQALPLNRNHVVLGQRLMIAAAIIRTRPTALRAWLESEIESLAAAPQIPTIVLRAAVDLIEEIAGTDCSMARIATRAVFRPAQVKQSIPLRGQGYRADEWSYGESLKACLSKLVAECGLGALELAETLLEDLGETAAVDEQAWLRYQSVAAASLDDSDDLLGRLLGAVRETAEELAQKIGSPVLGYLEGRGLDTASRIALHVRTLYPDIDPKGTERIIADCAALANPRLRQELGVLLVSQSAHFTQEALARFLRCVEALPDRADRSFFLQSLRTELPAEASALLADSEMPSEASASKDVHEEELLLWVGPTSPISADEMAAMTAPELTAKLNAWKYRRGWRLPEPEGLARELAAFSAAEYERVSEQAEAFEMLEQPTYVRGIVQGLANAVEAGHSIAWEPVLQFCAWAIRQQRGEEQEGNGLEQFDTTWGPARKQIAWLIEKGTRKSDAQIPFRLKTEIWRVLPELLVDSEPTEQTERERSEYQDPSTMAINTVRGVALSATLSYALWVARNSPQSARSWESLGLTQTRRALEERLANDASPATRSVFGKWFAYLFWLDAEWTKLNLGQVFPLSVEERPIWTASWEAYLMFTGTLYIEFLALLRASYERALEVLGSEALGASRAANPDERLGGHLVLFYRESVLSREDPLFLDFFTKVGSDLRFRVMSDAARAAGGIRDDKRKEALRLLQDFWEWRFEQVVSTNADDYRELSSFSWWFLHDEFPAEWRLAQLERSQEVGAKLELDGPVLEKLAELGASHLPEVVACLDAIVKNPANEHWGLYDDRAQLILRKALAAPDVALRTRSEDLVNYIGSLGFLNFRDLLRDAGGDNREGEGESR
jgi:hypothetical protein